MKLLCTSNTSQNATFIKNSNNVPCVHRPCKTSPVPSTPLQSGDPRSSCVPENRGQQVPGILQGTLGYRPPPGRRMAPCISERQDGVRKGHRSNGDRSQAFSPPPPQDKPQSTPRIGSREGAGKERKGKVREGQMRPPDSTLLPSPRQEMKTAFLRPGTFA